MNEPSSAYTRVNCVTAFLARLAALFNVVVAAASVLACSALGPLMMSLTAASAYLAVRLLGGGWWVVGGGCQRLHLLCFLSNDHSNVDPLKLKQ